MSSLPLKVLRNRAHQFTQEWQDESREHAEAKSFWDDFFHIFDINRRRVASFETAVKKHGKRQGFIDLFWPGKLIIEHKSKGKDLDKAYAQATEYFEGIKAQDLPRYVLVSDFARFRLYDLDLKTQHNFNLRELPDNLHVFSFIHADEQGQYFQEYELNIKAAELLGKLHDALETSGYSGHALEVFLMRVLFCLFAEDTGIFDKDIFIHYLQKFTAEHGMDTDMHLQKIFQVLDTPENQRNKNLSDELNQFPYVNGHLFTERLDMPSFDEAMREQLIECAHFDWADISPAIFGSLFQSIMNKQARRNLGAHYTSEENILKVIEPLFLQTLWDEFNKIKKMRRGKQARLIAFQQKLSDLHFLDPACGCGNFLIITYREIRRLELAVLSEQHRKDKQHLQLDIEPLISLAQFHGIEIEEWPSRIAEVAMWLTQHQMNREFAQTFGREPDLLPLKTAADIHNDNALALDWAAVVALDELDYIFGNPPFLGNNYRNSAQNQDMDTLFQGLKNYKSLDFVSCWFYKAAQLIENRAIQVGFVSTNSISQGEQVATLWQPLLDLGVKITFAHRTFAWQSEAKGKAAVHVVIVGFGHRDNIPSRDVILFDYPDIKAKPEPVKAKRINPYLQDAPDVVVGVRMRPLGKVSKMIRGSEPADGGNLLLSQEEKNKLIEKEPLSEKWLKPFLGAREFINAKERWCLWLINIQPKELRKLPEILKRVQKVKEMRLASKKIATQKKALTPTLFKEIRQPQNGTYILIPRHTSESREYIPMGFFNIDTISSDANQIIPDAKLYEFGILESKMHMAWMRAVAGRLKSDYRYSSIVYNNFPWPAPNPKQKAAIEKAAQAVLDARENHPDSSLADLYDPLTMPLDLRKAHQQLDKAVDNSYKTKLFKASFKQDSERLAFLFERYQQLSNAD